LVIFRFDSTRSETEVYLLLQTGHCSHDQSMHYERAPPLQSVEAWMWRRVRSAVQGFARYGG